jgi:5-deoxy-glucuronate isomerase
MSELLLRHKAPDGNGLVHRVTPESAGWKHVGFELYRLRPGQTLEQATGEREACLVLLGGRADVVAGGQHWENIGERAGPFEKKKPYSVYVAWHERWRVTARTELELAVCTAPGGDGFATHLIAPEDVAASVRGKGTNVRYVHDILPEGKPANALLVVEVITPGGHWSSYPSHKHDRDDLPNESLLEETYYHRIDPPQGFAFQRVYTDDRSLDQSMAVEDGDVVLVPKGYHPCAAAHGYDLYYLNVMAGPKRTWRFYNEPAHEWLIKA